MPATRDLFGDVEPLAIWITLAEKLAPEDVYRGVTLRIRQNHRRSVSATVMVDVYAPEWSILVAMQHTVRRCQEAQMKVTPSMLHQWMSTDLNTYVEPF